jgi:hypothetical protein
MKPAVFLCDFAPLREKSFFNYVDTTGVNYVDTTRETRRFLQRLQLATRSL